MATNANLLAAADAVRAVLPTGPEIGTVLPKRPKISGAGFLDSWSVIEAEVNLRIPVPALRWPQSVLTYEDMRRDAQVQGLLNSVWLPIRHMNWYVDPANAPASAVEEISEDFGLPVMQGDYIEDGPGIDFDEHLRLSLLALGTGHRFFEESGEIVGEGSGSRYRLRTLTERPPTTIQRINVLPNGDLDSIWQYGMPIPEIPADFLLSYVWDREGGNWAGRPLLYGLYKNWLLKDQLLRSDAAKSIRFNGIPVVETTQPGITREAQEEAAIMAQALQSGNGAGLSTPYGTRLRLLGIEGTAPDTVASITYHDQQMARAFMQMFAELGTSNHGSRALGLTLVDHYALGVLAMANWIRKSTMVLVRRIGARNYGIGAPMPQIKFRQDDREDMAILDLVALIDAGAVVVDDELEANIRERGNLPPRDTAQPGRPVPTAPGFGARSATARGRSRKRGRHTHSAATDTLTDEPPAPAEGSPAQRSGVDFPAMQTTFGDALGRAKALWAGVSEAQYGDLVGQVREATGPGDIETIVAKVIGKKQLAKIMLNLVGDGADQVAAQFSNEGFEHQGLRGYQAAVDAIEQATDQVTKLLGSNAEQTVKSKALALTSESSDPDEVADQVQEYVDGLAGQTPAYELHGLAMKAQNTGRFLAYGEIAPDGTTYYASELLDSNTCAECAENDGHAYDSLEDAMAEYPTGYALCEGGNLCRGTIVGVAPDEETPTVDDTGSAYSDDQERDDHGRFSGPGSSGGSTAVGALAEPGGGFTIDPHTGESVDKGYAVAVEGHSGVYGADEFFAQNPDTGRTKGAEIFEQYVRDNADLFSQPGIHIGGWRDPESGKIFLDPSEVVSDKDQAIQLGKDRDQIAIYDLGTGTEIPTGGTGGVT